MLLLCLHISACLLLIGLTHQHVSWFINTCKSQYTFTDKFIYLLFLYPIYKSEHTHIRIHNNPHTFANNITPKIFIHPNVYNNTIIHSSLRYSDRLHNQEGWGTVPELRLCNDCLITDFLKRKSVAIQKHVYQNQWLHINMIIFEVLLLSFIMIA